MVLSRGGPQSPRSKAGAKWLSKIRKGQVAPKGLHSQQLKTKQLEMKTLFNYENLDTFSHLNVYLELI